MTDLLKYPRTPHLASSRLQPGDEDLARVSLRELEGLDVVVEEKVDGSNSGISFDSTGEMRLQSRGHYLSGGPRERQFARLKAWAAEHRDTLWELLGDRYVCYGEWVFATHTIFYDALPAYFLEFDIWDRRREVFLDTESRQAMLAGSPVVSVPVLWRGVVGPGFHLPTLAGATRFSTPEVDRRLLEACQEAGLDAEAARRRADASGLAEGLYVKSESGGVVTGRFKWIRSSFSDFVAGAGDHWLDLPLVRNRRAAER